MDDYLPKPVRKKDLADLLARLGSRGPAPAELPAAPVTEPGGDAPPIDPAALDGLLQQLGDAGRATRRAVLDSYLDQGAGWIGELVTAAQSTEGRDTVARIAHTMRSSSEIVGARRLADLLRAAEDAGRAGTGDLAAQAVAVEAEYHRVAAALGRLRADDETRETL
jgi:HPt (histidine-containing phosphotransfer) domain-containing protein